MAYVVFMQPPFHVSTSTYVIFVNFGGVYNIAVWHLSKKPPEKYRRVNHEFFVIRLGLEPRAHTLKVYCSTN